MPTYTEETAPDRLVAVALDWCPAIEDMENFCIAGGFIRAFFANETPNDMDMYFESEDDYTDALDILETAGWHKVCESDMATTYTSPTDHR